MGLFRIERRRKVELSIGYIIMPLIIFWYANIHQKSEGHFLKIRNKSILSLILKADALMMLVGTFLTIIYGNYIYLNIFNIGFWIFLFVGVLMVFESLIFGKKKTHGYIEGVIKMNYLELSKEVAYALRHAPWEYELEIDENGWVNLDQLLASLSENRRWKDVRKIDLEKMIEISDKKRYEIVAGKIRALYGHSISNKIIKEVKEPPEVLYHGTTRYFISAIKEKGLLPKGRQYVHLSVDLDTANKVGKKRDDKPVILKIKAKLAWKEGVSFYKGNDKVWLADFIESKYIEFE